LDATIWASRSRVIPVAFWNRPITRPLGDLNPFPVFHAPPPACPA
jgi:hypothetical protein